MFVPPRIFCLSLTIPLTLNKTNNKGQSPEQSDRRGARPAEV